MLTAIAAVSQSWGIGLNGRLLFRIPEDLHRFRDLTVGGTVIMGRRTLESLPGGRPLPDRTTVVLTRRPDFFCPGAAAVHGTEELLALLPDLPGPYFAAGGDETYRLLLPHCGAALLTRVGADPAADAFFPRLDALPDWHRTEVSAQMESGGVGFRFERWERCGVTSDIQRSCRTG